jgi:tRNA-specific 2-thiouridylase
MSEKKSVLVAMSGGVDSSVTAGLLKRAGYDCTGVFMCLGQSAKDPNKPHPGCCSPQDARDARDVAACLGIKFSVLNFQHDLEAIIDYFVDEYRNARTPNPCIMCNSRLKFGKLMQYASAIGADFIATGHYAQIRSGDGCKRLARSIDDKKDQSYVLFNLDRTTLDKILLPLGGYTKPQVRKLATEMNLPVRDKAESQEICFVADDDYARFVAERAPELCRPGKVVDTKGKTLGEHNGIFHYTIGQRRGLGIALGEPAYVVALDAAANTVVLGTIEELMHKRLLAAAVNWLVEPPPSKPFRAVVQIRYNHRGAPAMVTPLADENGKINRVVVDFENAVKAITPGQAAVFYDDDQAVIGGGWIEKSDN